MPSHHTQFSVVFITNIAESNFRYTHPHPGDATQFVAAAKALSVPLTVVDVASEEACELYDADLALVRPDQIIAWRGDEHVDPVSVLGQAAGHCPL